MSAFGKRLSRLERPGLGQSGRERISGQLNKLGECRYAWGGRGTTLNRWDYSKDPQLRHARMRKIQKENLHKSLHILRRIEK